MRTRFAPSPTGPLHLGHAYSVILAHDMAKQQGGTFFLRIEDIDPARSRPKWEQAIYEDLHWLGLSWEREVLHQSARLPAYASALDALWAQGFLYPCTCNRKDILAALDAPQERAHSGPDGLIYPGTCRHIPKGARPPNATLRVNLGACTEFLLGNLGFWNKDEASEIYFNKLKSIENLKKSVGDFVICRKDFHTSYHLSVCVDDAHQGITDVIRGADLFEAAFIHIIVQTLLGLPTPRYFHHKLIRDTAGKRLAKRDDAKSIAAYRAAGASAADIRTMLSLGTYGLG